MVVLAALALILGVQLPLWARSREPGQKASCFNNLRRLGQAILEFSMENGGNLPGRTLNPYWPQRLRGYYGDTNLLICPADPRQMGQRSYIYNGWSDHYQNLRATNDIPESIIAEPAATILFGEKHELSVHFYADLSFGDDLFELELGRHFKTAQDPRTSGSNHAMADGSVRFLKYGQSFAPTNLWAVVPEWRTNSFNVP